MLSSHVTHHLVSQFLNAILRDLPTKPSSVQMKWISKPNDTVVSIGRPLYVACDAEGSPTPRITWKKGPDQGQDGFGFHELRFGSVSLADAGNYECRASNGVDEDLVARIKLDVKGK